MIASGKYHGSNCCRFAADGDESIELKVYYVYGSGESSYKLLESVTTLDFLENKKHLMNFITMLF